MTSDEERNDGMSSRGTGVPRGSMIGTGIAIGAGFGVAIGVAFDKLALGIPIGAAIGATIGAALERRGVGTAAYAPPGRQVWVLIGLGLALLLGLVVFLVVLGLG